VAAKAQVLKVVNPPRTDGRFTCRGRRLWTCDYSRGTPFLFHGAQAGGARDPNCQARGARVIATASTATRISEASRRRGVDYTNQILKVRQDWDARARSGVEGNTRAFLRRREEGRHCQCPLVALPSSRARKTRIRGRGDLRHPDAEDPREILRTDRRPGRIKTHR